MNAMKKQAEDTLKSWFAQSAGENEKLDSMTYVGNYFLTEKDGAVKSFCVFQRQQCHLFDL